MRTDSLGGNARTVMVANIVSFFVFVSVFFLFYFVLGYFLNGNCILSCIFFRTKPRKLDVFSYFRTAHAEMCRVYLRRVILLSKFTNSE